MSGDIFGSGTKITTHIMMWLAAKRGWHQTVSDLHGYS
jgi:hypothetical protein